LVAERHGHAQATMTLNRYAHAFPSVTGRLPESSDGRLAGKVLETMKRPARITILARDWLLKPTFGRIGWFL
jgi:hypothetical protein